MSAQPAHSPRLVSVPAPRIRIAACHGCGVERPVTQLLMGQDGPQCDRCGVHGALDDDARAEAWRNLRTGAGLIVVTTLATVATVLASGRLPFVGVDPAVTVLAFSAGAGIAALSTVWGLWAAWTGGDRRVGIAPNWRTATRGLGAGALLTGATAGLVVTVLTALGLLPAFV